MIHRFGLHLVIALALCACFAARGDQALTPAEQQARELGAQGNAAATDAATEPDTSQYPWYQGTDVPETGYYDDGTAIEQEAQAAAATDPVGQYVQESAVQRPSFAFGDDEPMFQHEDQANASANALTETYAGCQVLSVDEPGTYTEASCAAGTLDPAPTCTDTLSCACDPQCDAAVALDGVQSDMPFDYTMPGLTLGQVGGNYWSGDCTVFDRSFVFTLGSAAQVKEFMLSETHWDDWQLIEINGTVVSNLPMGGDRLEVVDGRVWYSESGSASCSERRTQSATPNQDVRSLLHDGVNTIHLRTVVVDKGESWARFRLSGWCDCADTWTRSCSDDVESRESCQLIDTVCIEGANETRIVDGIPVTRDCWVTQERYACDDPMEPEDAACDALRADGCEQMDASCTATDESGLCTQWRYDFRCPTGEPATTAVTVCGSDLYCPGGACVSDVPAIESAAEDLPYAATMLAAAQTTADDFDADTLSLFKGEGMKCSKDDFGYADCCADDGWGQDIGLAQCSADEQTLGLAKQAGMTHYVGSYSTGLFNTTTKKSYCVYGSLLSRIINEAGHEQFDIDWGSAREPNCRALTTEEVEALDWSIIDFSEFYATASANADAAMQDMETSEEIEQRLESELQRMIESGSPNGDGGGG